MGPVPGILLGAACSGGTAFCLGIILFRRLGVSFKGIEQISLTFVAGAACFSQLLFLLSAVGLARSGVFLVIALLSLIAAAFSGGIGRWQVFADLTPRWRWLFRVLFTAFSTVYLVNAVAPEMSADGSAYHLPFVARYLDAHGFQRIPQNFYASLSQGIELLFLPAFALGRHSAAAMVHFLFLLNLPILMISHGRRFGFPLPATAAAFLVFASPLLGWVGTSAYVDVAAAAIVFGLYHLLQIWDTERRAELLLPIGMLAGFSYAAKYTAAIAIPYTIAFVLWRLHKGGKPLLRPLLTICGAAAFFVLPWMAKNAIIVQNPVAPFANRIFPNSHVHVSFEEQYSLDQRHYQLTHWHNAPWELTVNGDRLQGFFGPIFLLLPLGLFSLREREGRRLLLAGTIFALPWFLNIGARYLIPALPPLTLAMALALRSPATLLPGIAILHAVLSWYATPLRYFDEYAPRLSAFPLRAALRLEPEAIYLQHNSTGYRIDRMIERSVPAGEKVFSFEQVPEAWTSRDILVGYASAGNEVLSDILRAPLSPATYPECGSSFHFPARQIQRLRAIQTANTAGQMWSVSEVQFLENGKPLKQRQSWRMTAHPNPWGVPLAFDGSRATRWRSWEVARPGMYIEVDFGKPVSVDEVRWVATPDTAKTIVEFRAMDARGGWHPLNAHRSSFPLQTGEEPRRAAVQALFSRGIRYLLVSPGAFGANDFHDNARMWGIRPVSETDGTRLYSLGPDSDVKNEADDPAPQNAAVPGVYDDADSHIALRAAWIRDVQFPDAEHHTLSYTNIPGGSASLLFTGDAVTYVYTRAHNRGIAEVLVDGKIRERLDLYSPETEWKSRAKYSGLGPGTHTIQIRATGERNPKSVDGFIDLDGFVIE